MTNQPEGNLTGAWAQAKKQAASLGVIPSSFSVVIRALINDQLTFNAKLRPVNKFQVARLLKGPSFKVMLYFATKTLRPAALSGQQTWTLGSMMAAYEPLDIAALIASFVYFRKCRKVVPDHSWGRFALSLLKDPQLGAGVGTAIPEIGTGVGLLVSSFQHFARCSFVLKNTPEAARYLEATKKISALEQLKLEEELFKCSAAQVAVMLLSNVGFGTEVSNGFSMALDPTCSPSSLKDPWAQRMKYARVWVDAASEGLNQPSINIPVQYFPKAERLGWLTSFFEDIRDGGVGWLQRTKNDLNPKVTPELFTKGTGLDDIPEALRDVFSLEEITGMEEEDFDDLVDQIDEDQASGKHPEVLDGKDLNALEDMVS